VRGHAPYKFELNLNSWYQNYDNLSFSVLVGFSRKDSNLLRIFPKDKGERMNGLDSEAKIWFQ